MKVVQEERQVKRMRINHVFRAWLEVVGMKEGVEYFDFLDKGKILIVGSFDEKGSIQDIYIGKITPTAEIPSQFFDVVKRFRDEYSLLKKKVVAVFYNENYHDCFTIVLNEKRVEPNGQVLHTCLSLNKEGGWYHTDVVYSESGDNSHLGKMISFEDLPTKVLKTVFTLYPAKGEGDEDKEGVGEVEVEEMARGKEERKERRKKRRRI